MNIIPDLSQSCKDVNTLQNLVDKIDSKILRESRKIYEESAYGIQGCTAESVSTLSTFRQILIKKMLGCGWHSEVKIESLISKINQLTV